MRVEGEGWNQTGQNQTQQEIIECILNCLHEKKPNLITFFFFYQIFFIINILLHCCCCSCCNWLQQPDLEIVKIWIVAV